MFSSRRTCAWCKNLIDDNEPTCTMPYADTHEHGHFDCFMALGRSSEEYCKSMAKLLREQERKKEELVESALKKLTDEERQALLS